MNRGIRSVLGESLALVVAGAVVAVIADLVLPEGVIGRVDEVSFHVESLVEVRLRPTEEAVAMIERGELLLVDLRSADEQARRSMAGSVAYPLEQHGSQGLAAEVLEAVAMQDTLIVAGDGGEEDARRAAQTMVLEFSAASSSTVEGGFEALAKRLPQLLVESTP